MSTKDVTENARGSDSDSETCEENGATKLTCIADPDEPLGNLSKFTAFPPGYSGKRKKGHLIFHACFQSGNLGRIDSVSEFEYDLYIRPDTCNPRYRVWFNFTVQNVSFGQKVVFNIVNFSKTKSLYRDGMSPVVKSSSRPKWIRISAKNVFYYKCPEHKRNYVLSFAFAFDREDDVYQFAYCFPYTYNRLQSYLAAVEDHKFDYVTRERLCVSVQQRNVDVITITSPKNLDKRMQRRVVFITARVHPGETPASFVCQGFMDFLISMHPIAQVLRECIVFKVVPMLNPDGVVLGNYRCSLMGFDLNRYWEDPSPWAHPTILATKQLLLELNEDPLIDLDFYIDLHAHSTATNGFMYGNVYDDDERLERHSVFPRLLCANADDFSYGSSSFNRDAIKAGTGRRTLGACLSERSNCYTLEVSFFSYISGYSGHVPYTEEGYLKLGRNLARTFLDYYKLNFMVAQKLRQDPAVIRDDLLDIARKHEESKDLRRDESAEHALKTASSSQKALYRSTRYKISSSKAGFYEDANLTEPVRLTMRRRSRNSSF